MSKFVKSTLARCLVSALALMAVKTCWAIDYQPFDWVPLPPHATAAMVYYQYANRNQFNSTIAGNIKRGTNLDSNVEIVRVVYYEKGWDMNIVVPFGTLQNGRIGGAPLNDAGGVGDPIASAGGWLIAKPAKKRFLSAASYVTIPIGSYDRHQALNLGGNRWQNDFQSNYTQGFLGKWTIDTSTDWVYYGDNNKAGDGNQSLRQKSSYGGYVWLSYDTTKLMHSKLPSFLSGGYLLDLGGAQRLDGVPNGMKTVEHQLRGTYTRFLTPSWQVLASASHDVSVTGQFKQNFAITFRLAKVFGVKEPTSGQ